jgi:hypothetical protein
MPKKKKPTQRSIAGRPDAVQLSEKESLKRMREFSKRKEQFIAAIRKGKSRGVSA